jgi:hypothetical protein
MGPVLLARVCALTLAPFDNSRHRWHTLEDFAIVVFMLLREELLQVTDFISLNTTLLQGPARLLTQDIVRAWQHYKCGHEIGQIPALNRAVKGNTSSSATAGDSAAALEQLRLRQREFDAFVAAV